MAQFEVDSKNKTFIITLKGFVKTGGADTFVDDLKEAVSQINPKQFNLVVDSTELRTFKPDILPVLENSYRLYMSFGFNDILMVKPQKVTPRLQLRRIAKKVNFTGKFMDSRQEAIEF